MPVFVGASFLAAFLLPKNVGALANMLVMSDMPVFGLAAMRTAVPLPKKVGALPNGLFKGLLGFG